MYLRKEYVVAVE